MKKIVLLCLMTLSINAVLIQTVLDENSPLKNLVRISVLLFVVFVMLIRKQPMLVVLFLLIIVSSISLLMGNNFDQLSFIFVFLFIPFLLNQKQRDIEKYLLIGSFSSLGLVFLFLLMGVTQNEIEIFRNRMTYGTDGVPFFFNLVYGSFTILIVYVMKYFKRFRWIFVLLSAGAVTHFYLQTDIRGGYLAFIVFVVMLVISPITKYLKHLIALIPVFALSISFYLATLGNDYYANQLLSYRPLLLHSFLEKINIIDILFSTSVKAFDNVAVVDNSYIHLLVGGGLLLSIGVGVLFYKAVLNLYKHKKYIEIAFVVSACVYFLTESLMVRIENMFVIYFWFLIIKYSLTKIEVEQAKLPKSTAKRKIFKRYKIVW